MRTSTRKRFCLLAAVSMVMAGWPLLEVTSASAEPAGVHRAGTTVPAAPTIAPTAPVVARATATPAPEDSLTGDITFSVPSGTFSGQLSVQLGTTVENAEIRYTTDGSVPVATSSLSSGSGVAVTKTTQVRAQAFVGGTATGAMGTAIYVARGINATHDLPLVVMDAYGGGKPAREYKDVSVMVMDASGGTSSLAQTPALTTRGGFHLRGQSSANFDKAPYRVEFWNNKNKDADLPVLGMPADSDWILRGPFPDKSLIREAFAYTLGRDIGIAAPRFAFVELYLNLDNSPMAANDYQGVYMFIENIKRSPDRVNIAKLKKTQLKEPEISGGYVLQFNLMSAEPPTLTCTGGTAQAPCWKDLEVKEPEELQPAQQTWITNYVQKFHDALHGPNPSNTQTGYPAYIDVDSFVNMIIVNEVAREGDSYLRSTHLQARTAAARYSPARCGTTTSVSTPSGILRRRRLAVQAAERDVRHDQRLVRETDGGPGVPREGQGPLGGPAPGGSVRHPDAGPRPGDQRAAHQCGDPQLPALAEPQHRDGRRLPRPDEPDLAAAGSDHPGLPRETDRLAELR